MLTHGSNPKQVALTFDDGPGEWTGPLLAVLEKFNAQATFFVLGKHARDFPELIAEIREAGHEIGNHSEDHLCLGDFPEDVVREQIMACEEAIGKVPLFRPPYGRLAQTPVEDIASSMGYKTVMWSVIPGDWAAKSTQEIIDCVRPKLAGSDKGEIVLLHDSGPKGGEDRRFTVDAVDELLDLFSDKQFVTVSELET